MAGDSLALPPARETHSRREDAASRTDAIKEAFRRSWQGYRKYAWGHDSLRPLSNGFYDDRYGHYRRILGRC